MKVILVRHGQTDYNRDGIWMGRKLDTSINEVGRTQMSNVIPELKLLNPELIISSPMKRTRESAEIIKKALGIPLEFDDRIVEIDLGSLSGQHREKAAFLANVSLEEAIRQYRIGQYDYIPFGGESAEDILERTKKFLRDLAQRKEKSVIVMSHGGLIRSLHRVIAGDLSLADRGIPNASVIVLEYG